MKHVHKQKTITTLFHKEIEILTKKLFKGFTLSVVSNTNVNINVFDLTLQTIMDVRTITECSPRTRLLQVISHTH